MGGVEVDDFLGRGLECCEVELDTLKAEEWKRQVSRTEDDWVSWENRKLWVQLVKEVQLINGTSNSGSKEQHITLQPRDLDWRVLEAGSWPCLGGLGLDLFSVLVRHDV